MSAEISCDGPECEEVKFPNTDDAGAGWIALKFWINITQDDDSLDFHNRQCLAAWLEEHPE